MKKLLNTLLIQVLLLLPMVLPTSKTFAQLYINTTDFKVMTGTDVFVSDATVGSDLVVAASGTISNDGTITLASDALLQEISNQAGLGIISGAGTIQITTDIFNGTALDVNVGGLGMTVTTSDNLGTTTIIRGHVPVITNQTISRYYEVISANTPTTVDLVFAYDQSEILTLNETDLSAISKNLDNTWTDMTIPPDINTNTVELLGVTSLTSFSLEAPVGLPIKLLSWGVKLINDQTKIDWTTVTEIDNDFFTIERSQDGESWTNILEVAGAGDSNDLLNYTATDENPPLGMIYYRLKQTDYDGKYAYFDIKTVQRFSDEIVKVVAYPNPVTDQITLEATPSELGSLRVLNMYGQEITDMISIVSTGDSSIQMDLNNLKTGMYIINTRTKSTRIIKR